MATKIYREKCKDCPKVIESLYEKQAKSLMESHKQTHGGKNESK